MGNLDSLARFCPEIALTATLVVVLVTDLFLRGKERGLTAIPAAAGIACAAVLLFVKGLAGLGAEPPGSTGDLLRLLVRAPGGGPGAGEAIFGGMIVDDPLGFFFKMIFLATAFGVVLYGRRSRDVDPAYAGEFHVFALAVTLGLFLMASASDLVMVYLAVEMVSITSYVLAGYVRKDVRSGEAAMKYVIYGGVASGVMIFGLAMLYGLTGSTNLTEIGERIGRGLAEPVAGAEGGRLVLDAAPVLVAFVLVLAGLAFKMAVAPFHMWCPDVYEGAPTAVTAFLSVGPKAAGFALLLRFLTTVALRPEGNAWVPRTPATQLTFLLAVLSVLTMTIGNLSALRQTNLKRLLAYSSVAHAGYLLMGCVVATRAGFESILFYLAIYAVMNLGAFFSILLLAQKLGSEEMSDYAGAGWRAPAVGAAMVVFLVSLTGLPPTGGFLAKFWLFSAVLRGGGYVLVLIALVNSVVSLAYYLSIARVMFLHRPPEGAAPLRLGWVPQAGLVAMAALLVLLQVRWEPVMRWAQWALR